MTSYLDTIKSRKYFRIGIALRSLIICSCFSVFFHWCLIQILFLNWWSSLEINRHTNRDQSRKSDSYRCRWNRPWFGFLFRCLLHWLFFNRFVHVHTRPSHIECQSNRVVVTTFQATYKSNVFKIFQYTTNALLLPITANNWYSIKTSNSLFCLHSQSWQQLHQYTISSRWDH